MALLVNNPSANVGDIRDEGSILGLARSLGKEMAFRFSRRLNAQSCLGVFRAFIYSSGELGASVPFAPQSFAHLTFFLSPLLLTAVGIKLQLELFLLRKNLCN